MNGQAEYYGIGPEQGTIVTEKDAYRYALERCLFGTMEEQAEFREMLVEWFYSGNWIKKEEEQDGERTQHL
ncbi:MAG: hypothetical protein Q4F29_13980 [Lachnospiraceae bacterium]|nr:hypothetical protein [Lachnospiraceae bacterium]